YRQLGLLIQPSRFDERSRRTLCVPERDGATADRPVAPSARPVDQPKYETTTVAIITPSTISAPSSGVLIKTPLMQKLHIKRDRRCIEETLTLAAARVSTEPLPRRPRRAMGGKAARRAARPAEKLAPYLTVRMPFIPAAAWPGTVQRYSYLPGFVTVTFSVAVFPGATIGVTLPAQLVPVPPLLLEQSLKSCVSAPLFENLNVSAPCVTELFESTNLKSLLLLTVTLTVVATVFFALASAGTAA